MQILSTIATLAFIAVGALVGIRLLVLSARTRGLPEFSVGLALLLIGGIGYPISIVAGAPGWVAPGTGIRLMTVAAFLIDAGCVAVLVFTWSVFRRDAVWGRALLGVLSLAYLGHVFAIVSAVSSGRLVVPTDLTMGENGITLLGQVLNFVVFGWTACESYRYWWMLRRRAAIGLGDPVVTNRFLLWAVAASASLATNAVGWWIVFANIDFFHHDGAQAALGLFCLLSCGAQYLAFLPPRAYTARLRAAG